MQTKITLISIITINFNFIVDTIKKWNSAFNCDYFNKEIVVIDPPEFFGISYPMIIFSKANNIPGFAWGINLGLSLSNGNNKSITCQSISVEIF